MSAHKLHKAFESLSDQFKLYISLEKTPVQIF